MNGVSEVFIYMPIKNTIMTYALHLNNVGHFNPSFSIAYSLSLPIHSKTINMKTRSAVTINFPSRAGLANNEVETKDL